MNSVRTEATVLNDYLRQENYSVSSIRVLENVGGEFESIIKLPQFSDFDTTITLQVPAGKRLQESNLVINLSKKFETKLSSFEIEELKTKISNYLQQNQDEFVLKSFFIEAYKLVGEQYKAIMTPSKETKAAKASKPSKKKETKSEDEEDGKSKLVSMKTAGDVVNRIHWDEKINQDFITVGYLDRFLGIKETEFNKFDWGDIVLADLNALAIPEHRIQYFKYKNELIWDKNQRFDNVYGSTGSNVTIYDVIKKLADVEFHHNDLDEEEVTRVGRPKPAKTTPNYFISIPVYDKEIKLSYRKLSRAIVDENPEVEDILVPESSLHITLCTLRIDTGDEMNIVRKVLNDMDKNGDLKKFIPIEMNFKNLGNFYDKVLTVKCNCEQMEKLNGLRDFILEKLKRERINLAGNYYDFVPHLTVLKITSRFLTNNGYTERENLGDFISKDLLKTHENYELGSQVVEELELCKMTSTLPYPIETTINLNK